MTSVPELPGLVVQQRLRGEGLFEWLRVLRPADGLTSLAKRPRASRDLAGVRALFAAELTHAGALAGPGVIRPREIVELGDIPVLLLDDPGGEPLRGVLDAGPVTLAAALGIAASLAETLAQIHDRGYTHRDVQPANVLFDAATGRVALTGLGQATPVPRERAVAPRPDRLEGGGAYLSPEQTGRTNRLLDYRTDLYSLGVLLFEMLAGRPPFAMTDPLELVHAHLAKEPPDLRDVASDVPPVVAALVARLLAKAASERYQSGRGVASDLRRCLNELRASGSVTPFELGAFDAPARVELPQRLYGRERELERLREAVATAATGVPQLVLIAGPSGVGKTSLVNAFRTEVARQGARFVSGGCRALEAEQPFQAIQAALRDLVRRLLMEPEARLAAIRDELLEVGPSLGALAEMIPELAALTGETRGSFELGPMASRNRLARATRQLLEVVTLSGTPLVMFLDDLQWVDPSTLALLESVLDPELGRILLVGTYRDDQVDERHPLLDSVARLRDGGVAVETLSLGPLGPAEVAQLVADALRLDRQAAAPLATLVYQRTAGSPFYIETYLSRLHEQGVLRFEVGSGWTWDLAAAAAVEPAEHAIEWREPEQTELLPGSRQFLGLAAALGDRFDAATLASALERPLDEVEADLLDACRRWVLVRQNGTYRFAHDRERERAYDLIPELERPSAHLHLARLLEARREAGADVGLFDVVTQVNLATPRLEPGGERLRAARLNLAAGEKARAAAAFPAARNYFESGLGLLDDDAWDTDYDVMLGLHAGAAEAAVLEGDVARVEVLTEAALARTRTLLDRMPLFETQITAAVLRQREDEGLAIVLAGLAALGFEVREPEDDAALWETMRRAGELVIAVPGTPAEQLPRNTDPSVRAAMRLICFGLTAAITARTNLFEALATTLVELTGEHGHCPESPVALQASAAARCEVFDDFEGGLRLGDYGLSLIEPLGGQRYEPLCRLWYVSFPLSRTIPNSALVEPLEQAERLGLETGYTAVGALAAFVQCSAVIHAGQPLHQALERLAAKRELYAHQADLRMHRALDTLRQFCLWLQGGDHRRADPTSVDSRQVRLESAWAEAALQDRVILGLELILSAVFRERDQGWRYGLRGLESPRHTTAGHVPLAFWICLGLLGGLERATDDERRFVDEGIDRLLDHLKRRAQRTPSVFAHKVALVEAERLRAAGRLDQALAHYERAISGAREHGYLHEGALANELSAEVFEAMGAGEHARLHRWKALFGYEAWGANAKVDQLETRYPDLRRPAGPSTPASPASPSPSPPAQPMPTDVPGGFDLAGLERAAQALSVTLDLESVLQQLMRLMLQQAGAQRGFLLRDEARALTIEATGSVDPDEVAVHGELPLHTRTDLAHAVVQYVARTGEPVVLADATQHDLFGSDPYIVRERPRSILCTPIVRHGERVGLVYLENNHIVDAFVADRLAAVRIIAAQAADALENARLHDRVQSEVTERRLAEEALRAKNRELEEVREQLQAENVSLKEALESVHGFHEIVGESEVLRRALFQVERVAPTQASVLVLGETGTGKELIARALHDRSPRKGRPFVKLNCAALPESLIESELFGHERGAFTGADRRREGRFERAHGGTLFLDEVGELRADMQAKLLRVLQEGEIERLGATAPTRVDVRVIAATNRDLEQAIAAGQFRSDLYYRLAVFPIRVPPLRERREDLPLLVRHFLRKAREETGRSIEHVPRAVMDALAAYDWPGNVRELQNVVERAVILSEGTTLRLTEQPGTSLVSAFRGPSEDVGETLEEVEKAHILRIVEACGWRIKGEGNAAERLGLNEGTLRSRMKKLGLKRPR